MDFVLTTCETGLERIHTLSTELKRLEATMDEINDEEVKRAYRIVIHDRVWKIVVLIGDLWRETLSLTGKYDPEIPR